MTDTLQKTEARLIDALKRVAQLERINHGLQAEVARLLAATAKR